ASVQRGDGLISTVGPFLRWGEPAVRAAIAAGAHYLDSTGEGAFIRQVFERFGPEARAAGSALVPAFGYDWVPGNLAGALALREAGEPAKRVDVGYFAPGGGGFAASGGTRAASVGIMLEPGFAWRGRVVWRGGWGGRGGRAEFGAASPDQHLRHRDRLRRRALTVERGAPQRPEPLRAHRQPARLGRGARRGGRPASGRRGRARRR